MRVKKYLALIFAAILATTMLTACPWEKEEDKTDDASSVPVTSTDTSQPGSDDDDDTPAPPAHLHPHLWPRQHRRDAVTGCFERQRHRGLLLLRPKSRE